MHKLLERNSPTDWQKALKGLLAGDASSYGRVYTVSPIERIGIVKGRLPAILVSVANDMHITRDRLYSWLGIARTTAHRKVNADDVLSQDESERALGSPA